MNYYSKYLKYKKKYNYLLNNQFGGLIDKEYGIGIECEFGLHLDISSCLKEKKSNYPIFMDIHNNLELNLIKIDKLEEYLTAYKYVFEICKESNFNINNYLSDMKNYIININKLINIIKLKTTSESEIIDIHNLNVLYSKYKKYIEFYGLDIKIYLYNKFRVLDDDKIRKIINNFIQIKETEINNFLENKKIIPKRKMVRELFGEFYEIKKVFNIDETDETTEYTNMFEIRNSNPKQTINEAITEIKELKEKKIKEVKEKLGNYSRYLKTDYEYGHIYIYDYETNEIKDDYNGSYHINLTLPYKKDIKYNEFEYKHINLIKSLQILSPLFLGVFSGVYPYSFGDNNKTSETSFRLKESGYMNFLQAEDIDNFYKDIKYDTREFKSSIITKIFDKSLKENELLGNDFRFNYTFNNIFKEEYFGFEFRFFDLFKIEYLETIIQFIFMLAEYLHQQKITIKKDPTTDKDILNNKKVIKNIQNINKEGWNTLQNKAYLNLINNSFNVYIKEGTAYDVLNIIYKTIKKKCKEIKFEDTEYLQYVLPNLDNISDNIPNINKENYNYFYKLQNPDEALIKKIKNDKTNEDYIDYINLST